MWNRRRNVSERSEQNNDPHCSVARLLSNFLFILGESAGYWFDVIIVLIYGRDFFS